MKSFLRIALLLLVSAATAQQIGAYQHGTVIRMRMSECMPSHHAFLTTFGGQAAPAIPEACPEYTLLSDKVVFIIVGRSSGQLIPLADVIDFRVRTNELAVRVDDAKHESRFNIKEMVLRSDWDLIQKHIANELNNPEAVADQMLVSKTRDAR